MLKSNPLAIRIIVFIIAPTIIGGIVAGRYLNSSLPQTRGELVVPGLRSVVTVSRDQHGVPYIAGENESDVYFAMGFVHAQDRLWQLELQRRMAQGRLSELFGKNSVRQDVWFRTLGLYEAGASSWDALSDQARGVLSAYSAGVNAWLATGRPLPAEFSLFEVRPEPWTPQDSLAVIKIFALDLAGNLNSEIERFLASQALDQVHLDALQAGYPKDAPLTVAERRSGTEKALAALLQLGKETEAELQIGGKFVGSNAWAVSGRLTDSGAPILANDPHLGLQIPSLWYAVSLKAPALHVSGMSLVGLPLVVFGENGDIAWAGTNMMADTQDLFVEQLNASNPRQYRAGDVWQDFETRTEEINVRADFPSFLRKPLKPIVIQVRKTRHGPVISDSVGAFEQPVALRWTALEPSDTTFEAFLGLHHATCWDDFKRAMARQVAPALNMLYADKANNIGYLAAGRIPIRKRGEGTVPAPGWTDEYDWVSAIPVDQLPQRLNPDEGYLVSANNRIVGDAYPYFISKDWASPARAQRIEQLLRDRIAAGGKLDIKAMQLMQADTVSLPAVGLLPYLTALRPADDLQAAALKELASWKGDMAEDSPAASIFHAWTRHLRQALFADEMAHHWNKFQESTYLDSVVDHTSLDQIRQALTDPSPDWCDDATTPERESCEEILRRSLSAALSELQKLKGSDVGDWKWGSVQSTEYSHPPFDTIKPLRSFFGRQAASGGSPDTVNVAASYFRESDGYIKTFGAGFRQVMEMGQSRTEHTFMNSTGQSGHFLSPHYDDMVQPFRRAEFYSIDPVQTPAEASVLRLQPQK